MIDKLEVIDEKLTIMDQVHALNDELNIHGTYFGFAFH
jgi:hypothetical protein